MTVYGNLKEVVGVPTYSDANYNKDILDTYFLRLARDESIRLPTGNEPRRFNYHGAYVFPPRAGLNYNVAYADLASLYPSTLRALNIGPDTIIGTQEDLDESDYDEDDCVWGYIDTRPVKHHVGGGWQQHAHSQFKMVYDPDGQTVRWADEPRYERCYYLAPSVREGFIASGVEDLVDMKYNYTGDLYEAVKRVVNSVYGAVSELRADNSGRLADWRFGESITLAGRKIIQWTADTIREQLLERYHIPMDETYVAVGDTDGCGICYPDASSREDYLAKLENCVEWVNDEGYADFMHETFGVARDAHHMEVEIESFAPALFAPAKDYDEPEGEAVKKTYTQHVTWDEGEEVDDIDVTGFEAVRSDVAPLARSAQTWTFEQLLRRGGEAQSDIFDGLRWTEQLARNGDLPITELAKRGGIGQALGEYGDENRKPGPLYRGAKYADQFLDVELSEGSKPFVVYLSSPDGLPRRTYDAETPEDGNVVDAISVEQAHQLPSNLDIDWAKHTEKALVDPLEPVLRTMGWSWGGVRDGSVQKGVGEWT
jgi:DNA polymerase elongation subunit (family B)